MDKQEVIQRLRNLRINSEYSYELAIELDETGLEHKKDIEALNTTISILSKEQSRKFNRTLVDKMLTEINEEYFSDKKHNGLWDVMENIKYKYRHEINELPE